MSFAFMVSAVFYIYYDIYYRGDSDTVSSVEYFDPLPGVVSTLWQATVDAESTAFYQGYPVDPGYVVTDDFLVATVTPGSYLLLPNTSTPSIPAGGVRKDFLLSFYDPDIGVLFPEIAEINCHLWNYDAKVCESPLADGDDHREWYWRALACPKYYGLGTVFEVLSPSWLVGEWICKDYGDLILPQGEYLDFLIPVNDIMARYDGNINNFPWSSPVETIVYVGSR